MYYKGFMRDETLRGVYDANYILRHFEVGHTIYLLSWFFGKIKVFEPLYDKGFKPVLNGGFILKAVE